MKLRRLILIILLAVSSPIAALGPDEILPDAALESRARDISAGLRCLVCQNQSIDDSDAELARDLRLLVRERLVAGDSNAEVEQFIVDRYGEYVLLNPRLSGHTLILWIAAPLLLLLGLVSIVLARRKTAMPIASALTADEEAALKSLERGDARP